MKAEALLIVDDAGAQRLDVRVRRAGAVTESQDWLADEVPVALIFNGISHAVMLATPLDLEDFALGFGLTEGLLAKPDELHGVEVLPDPAGVRVEMEVSSACFARLKDKRRSMAGRTGCGLCGTESLDQVEPPLSPLASCDTPLAPAAVAAALREVPARQALQQRTGATHAAAWCALDGTVRLVREDVGRHNALDKLAGALARAGVDPGTGAVVLTSRVSVEMVQKAVAMGAPVLIAISAPTALALRTAEAAGLTIAAVARGDGFEVFTHPGRLEAADR